MNYGKNVTFREFYSKTSELGIKKTGEIAGQELFSVPAGIVSDKDEKSVTTRRLFGILF